MLSVGAAVGAVVLPVVFVRSISVGDAVGITIGAGEEVGSGLKVGI